tara:strand:+ start:404 stop:736 length:333 start_codon:yes stop_codon:yes gene_type:complete
MTDIEVENKTGILRQTLHAWKTGKREPKPYHLMAIAYLLNVYIIVRKSSDSRQKYQFSIKDKTMDDSIGNNGRYQISTCVDHEKTIYETIIDTQYNSVVSRSAKKVDTYG